MNSLLWHKLIVSLDLNDKPAIKRVVAALPKVKIFKVGLIPFVLWGPDLLEYLNRRNKKVFLDLKFYDIPHTMAEALKIAMRRKVWGLTVHASNTDEALRHTVKIRGNKKSPLLIGVTQLTSKQTAADEVIFLARRAKQAGLNGVVASAQEVTAIKKELSRDFLVLTPGIRLPTAQGTDDQKRITTFAEAIRNGADYAIVGRPILQNRDYLNNAEAILST